MREIQGMIYSEAKLPTNCEHKKVDKLCASNI